MHDSSEQPRPPAVSIILPTYNRSKFLPQALASIRGQTFADWELIVVDDGSSDDTGELVRALTADVRQSVRYVYQQNQGAYAARNTGLDLARGRYVAFFDSDDVWLPHHLDECVRALDGHPDVDWVFGACRMVDYSSGRVLAPNTFYVTGRPRPFLRLKGRVRGRLRVIEDADAARCQILHGLYCGLQNSVIRQRVFAGYRFDTRHRNEAEDQVVVIRSLKAGYRFAFYDAVHVVYHIHGENSSGAAQGSSLEKRLRVHRAVVSGFEDMRRQVALSPAEGRALARRLSRDLFWEIGYALLWENGRRAEALTMFRRGLACWPWDWRYWKTYVLAAVRHIWMRRAVRPVSTGATILHGVRKGPTDNEP